MRDFLKRGGLIFLAVIFAVTGLGVGIYSFFADNNSSNNSGYINCETVTAGQQKPGENGKYEGAKLVDFKPVKSVDYLKCWDIKVGGGATATASSTITATYTGALANSGKIFQSSLDNGQPFTTQLTNVIRGWQASIPGMKEGGIRRVLIPSEYAYGPAGSSGIPPNSDLVFDVTLIDVQ